MAFNEIWMNWIGDNPDNWLIRYWVEVAFTGGNKIRLLTAALRDDPEGS